MTNASLTRPRVISLASFFLNLSLAESTHWVSPQQPTMADVVQYRLERMVNELDDLERRGVFSRREIAEIVKQRRKFEYRLKRPSPLKQDYLAYIEYEKQLDSLRRLRKKSVAREAKKKTMKSVSDFAGVSRILEIYQLAVMRYKGDIDLWFRYLEFCRERRNGRMKKVLFGFLTFSALLGCWENYGKERRIIYSKFLVFMCCRWKKKRKMN